MCVAATFWETKRFCGAASSDLLGTNSQAKKETIVYDDSVKVVVVVRVMLATVRGEVMVMLNCAGEWRRRWRK